MVDLSVAENGEVAHAPQDKVELMLSGVATMCGGDMQEMLLVLASATTHLAEVGTEGIEVEEDSVILTTSEGSIELTLTRKAPFKKKPLGEAISGGLH